MRGPFASACLAASAAALLASTVVAVPPPALDPPERTTGTPISGKGLVRFGDLAVVSDSEADAMAASAATDAATWDRCLADGASFLRRSADGSRIEFVPPWGAEGKDRLLAAYCDEGIVFVGGAVQVAWLDNAERASLFSVALGYPASATKAWSDSWVSVGVLDKYKLTAVRAIDARAHRILFAAVDRDGRAVSLVGSFGFRPPELPLPERRPPENPNDPVRRLIGHDGS